MSKRENDANNVFRPSDSPLTEHEKEQIAQRRNLERLRAERLAREAEQQDRRKSWALLFLPVDCENEFGLQNTAIIVAGLNLHQMSVPSRDTNSIARHVSQGESSLFLSCFNVRQFEPFFVGRKTVPVSACQSSIASFASRISSRPPQALKWPPAISFQPVLDHAPPAFRTCRSIAQRTIPQLAALIVIGRITSQLENRCARLRSSFGSSEPPRNSVPCEPGDAKLKEFRFVLWRPWGHD
jgi:hypothetical protein